MIDVEDGPEPDPCPDPEPEPDDSDIPEDAFDNIGRRVDTRADELGLDQAKRKGIASIFERAAKKMEDRELIRTSDALVYIKNELERNPPGAEFQPVLQLVYDDGSLRAPLTWSMTIDYYRAVAAGMKGGAL